MSTETEVQITDIIAFPTRDEFGTIRQATRVFGRSVILLSFQSLGEYRLDTRLRRSAASTPQDHYIDGEVGTGEAISVFRHTDTKTGEHIFGPAEQVIDLSNPFLSVTIIHELAHLVDRYHQPPRWTWSSGMGTTPFVNLVRAFSKTVSSRLSLDAMNGRFPEIEGPSGKRMELESGLAPETVKRLKDRARESRKGHEVFARCLTAFVIYNLESRGERGLTKLTGGEKEVIGEFRGRVAGFSNAVTGYDLSREDFEIVRPAMTALLKALGWSSHETQ